MRHGGDGDLRKAQRLARKTDDVKATEQPFPDSWVATTAPIALGLLTDIVTELVFHRGAEGQEKLWPLIATQYRFWCSGRDTPTSMNAAKIWSPCEALVRISCRELYRLSRRVLQSSEFHDLAWSDRQLWSSLLLTSFSDLLARTVALEDAARQSLLELKEKASLDKKGDVDSDGFLDYEVVQTSFGNGRPIQKDCYPDSVEIPDNTVDLDQGSLLQTLPDVTSRRKSSSQEDVNSIPSEVDGELSFVD